MAEGTSRPVLDYPFDSVPTPGTAREVAPGVHWVCMALPFPPDHINLWLLEDGDGWTIVDAGLARDETKASWESVFADTLRGRPVTRILVTHFHPDHIGLADWLCTRWAAPLWMTAAEWYAARAIHGSAGQADIDARLAFYRGNGAPDSLLTEAQKPNTFYRRGVPEVPPAFRRIRAGEPVRIGAHDWTPIIGRGHAPEHACLYRAQSGVLIGGDILLPRISPNVGVWPPEPFANPLRDYLESLDNFRHLPADTLVLPAHGLPYRGLHARIAALKAHHAERLDKLAAAIAERPLSAVDCFPLLFRREIGANNIGLAAGEALAHLHLLEDQGRARRVKDDRGVWRFTSAESA
jgi:glyoxylase-like metal-dependent hydrolase (beta-lactamase superfamily II)